MIAELLKESVFLPILMMIYIISSFLGFYLFLLVILIIGTPLSWINDRLNKIKDIK